MYSFCLPVSLSCYLSVLSVLCVLCVRLIVIIRIIIIVITNKNRITFPVIQSDFCATAELSVVVNYAVVIRIISQRPL